MIRREIETAAGTVAACLCLCLTFGCVSRRPVPAAPATPPPVAASDGTQSLEDLDRALRSGNPALVATIERSDRTTDKSATVKVVVSGLGLVDPQLVNED